MAPDLLWDGRVVMERNEGEVVRGMVGTLRLWLASLHPSTQDNASKLLLALMESRHDSENAERILISLRPQELVDVIKKAYLQEEERENSEVSPREVGHNIYILALQ
ncbi:PREDICTED: inositol 1,4,5-trisphosphate receptor type 3-like, partial [Rhinopithecus bieti]|uniref:inositol 1,4,5-trisphosphate receptor type 3-like n=1 Tax=Rhinopithecus bieti TaxID=61621 RepID=UPI00083C69A2